MAVEFVPIDRDTPYLFPPSVQDYLPEDHLARFVAEVVDQLDLSALLGVYAGKGKKPYHPSMLVAVLFYGYAAGTFSSRKLEKARHDSVAYRFLCANTQPEYDTVASFRKRVLKELEGCFVEILLIGQAIGLVKLGTVSLDGTKIKANASKHKALSWADANQLEAQLRSEVEALMRLAEKADASALAEEMDIPEELKRRAERLQKIAEAKTGILARAQARLQQGQAACEEKMARRKAKQARSGKRPGGRPSKAPTPGPSAKDQVNLTDEDSRIMPSSEGFKQSYNPQAGVDAQTHLIVEQHISQQPNDQQEIAPTPKQASAIAAMRHRLQTRAGKANYARRKSTVETVFGIIKRVQGFRQFLLRSRDAVLGEWSLLCIGWNLERLHAPNG